MRKAGEMRTGSIRLQPLSVRPKSDEPSIVVPAPGIHNPNPNPCVSRPKDGRQRFPFAVFRGTHRRSSATGFNSGGRVTPQLTRVGSIPEMISYSSRSVARRETLMPTTTSIEEMVVLRQDCTKMLTEDYMPGPSRRTNNHMISFLPSIKIHIDGSPPRPNYYKHGSASPCKRRQPNLDLDAPIIPATQRADLGSPSSCTFGEAVERYHKKQGSQIANLEMLAHHLESVAGWSQNAGSSGRTPSDTTPKVKVRVQPTVRKASAGQLKKSLTGHCSPTRIPRVFVESHVSKLVSAAREIVVVAVVDSEKEMRRTGHFVFLQEEEAEGKRGHGSKFLNRIASNIKRQKADDENSGNSGSATEDVDVTFGH